MSIASLAKPIAICDTTLCDVEFIPQFSLSLPEKILLAQAIAQRGVNVIQVGCPGRSDKQLDELFILSKKLQEVTLCGAAGSQLEEIARVAVALKPAARGRINILAVINHRQHLSSPLPFIDQTDPLDQIRESVSLAREYCSEVAWSAIGVAHPSDFLCRSIETAIQSGATAITLVPKPPTDPTQLIDFVQQIMHRVVNIEQASVGLNWHHLDLSIDLLLSLLPCGISHLEGSMNQISCFPDLLRDQIGWDTLIRAIHNPRIYNQSGSGMISINKIPQMWGK